MEIPFRMWGIGGMQRENHLCILHGNSKWNVRGNNAANNLHANQHIVHGIHVGLVGNFDSTLVAWIEGAVWLGLWSHVVAYAWVWAKTLFKTPSSSGLGNL